MTVLRALSVIPKISLKVGLTKAPQQDQDSEAARVPNRNQRTAQEVAEMLKTRIWSTRVHQLHPQGLHLGKGVKRDKKNFFILTHKTLFSHPKSFCFSLCSYMKVGIGVD